MAITEQDVRHVAELARLGLPAERVAQLVVELNGILGHMDVLNTVDTERVQAAAGVGADGAPLRVDRGPQHPLHAEHERFAPSMRDGLFLVPRLATHHGAGSAPAGAPTADETEA